MLSSKNFWFFFAFLFFLTPSFAQTSLQAPDDFLPHELGSQFTAHHLLVDYFKHVAANSEQVLLKEYGRTNESRPLLTAFISSKKNMARLEMIRKDNLIRAGLLEGKRNLSEDIAIVWMSYGVHGNEAAASESAIATVYELVKANNPKVQKWLENTVVVLDPSINPDGYARYTHWYRGVSNKLSNPATTAREHNEPWPGGRVNHYLFDLNRDWAWQTQVETQQRLDVYQQWLPHIHVDFHEQGHNNPYYFAPAAQPFHEYITDWQAAFQTEIGKNHTRYFDKNGWLYFTKEVFDLFYPSYGDTYPTFNGAIGMTYEQGGHSRAGRAILLENGDTLSLNDRIQHHTTTGLSTVEICAQNATRLTKSFTDYFATAKNNPPGKYKSFIIKAGNSKAKLKNLLQFLDKHRIKYGRVKTGTKASAYSYKTGKTTSMQIATQDLVISAHQAKGILAQVLFEPEPFLVDSLTYDITAWALPHAYGLDAYALDRKLSPSEPFQLPSYQGLDQSAQGPYAYLLPWTGLTDAKCLAALLQKDIKVRYASKAFTLGGEQFLAGTLIANRADNRKNKNFDQIVKTTAEAHEVELSYAQSGYVEAGNDFGSSAMRLIQRPRVLALSGEGISPNDFGQLWHYFETDLEYPLTIVGQTDFSSVDLKDFNLLVLPHGYYSELSSSAMSKIKDWTRSGGRVIAMVNALSLFSDKDEFDLKKKTNTSSREDAIMEAHVHYGDRERKSISRQMPGAVFQTKFDPTHPLAFGITDHYYSLKTSSRRYAKMEKAWNVVTVGKNPIIHGFVGSIIKPEMKNTLVYGVEEMGRGSICYMVDNPLFRGFWYQGKLLFSNAVFFVGQ
ncbi:MAG: M14 family zinc carboxypeptidase [Saprospiraceae bacterium]